MTKKYSFKLYLSGRTPINKRLVKNLKSILEGKFKDEFSIEIINITNNPELANSPNVFATPMLIKQLPPPVALIAGNLTDREKLLSAMEMLTSEDS